MSVWEATTLRDYGSPTSFTATELNMNDVDMQAVATTKYTSPLIDGQYHANYSVTFTVTEVTATLGDAKLTIEKFESDGTTSIETEDIITAIPTGTNDATGTLVWGRDTTDVLSGSGTKSTDLPVEKQRLMYFKLILEVTTAADGTSSTCLVTMKMEK